VEEADIIPSGRLLFAFGAEDVDASCSL
jgi:hypothetical protein